MTPRCAKMRQESARVSDTAGDSTHTHTHAHTYTHTYKHARTRIISNGSSHVNFGCFHQLFIQQLLTGKYSHAVVFVDNAGADVVLGMVPLARVLLSLGCRVTMAANSRPVLNDITCTELQALLRSVARVDRTMASALQSG